MTVPEFVRQLEGQGFRLRVQGSNLIINPARRVTSTIKETLAELGPEIARHLHHRQTPRVVGVDWSRVGLYQLDRVLEVAVPWSDVRLVIVPGCKIARRLRATDPKPGRIWCVCEVSDLLLSGVTPEDARKIAATRLMFDATLDGVTRERASSEEASLQDEKGGRS